MTTVPDTFEAAVRFKLIDLGKGGAVLRSEHPELPGRPVLGLLDPGYPDSALQDKRQSCILTLHDHLTQLSAEFDIL